MTVLKNWILLYSNCQNTRQLKTSLMCRAAPVPTLAREARPLHLQTVRSTAAGWLKYDLRRCSHTNIAMHCYTTLQKPVRCIKPNQLEMFECAKAALLVLACIFF